MGRAAVRLMTAHEHWLICPMHLLWKYGRKACDGPDLPPMLPWPEAAPRRPGGTPGRSTGDFGNSTR